MIKARPKYPTDLYGTIYIDNIQKAVVICLIIPTTYLFDAGSRVDNVHHTFGYFFMLDSAIVLSVLLQYTVSDFPFGIFWPLCCLFFFDIQFLITFKLFLYIYVNQISTQFFNQYKMYSNVSVFILYRERLCWSYESWIYNYLCNQCLSPLKLRVWTLLMVRCTRYKIMW